MDQNTIAIIWDFDKTLISGYMQEPIFQKFNVDSAAFWEEVNSLPKKYAEKGIRVNTETIYLNHLITCANQGIFPGLNNQMLYDLGQKLTFYRGVVEIFVDLKEAIQKEAKFRDFAIHVEHYIVSTGLTQMIKGSIINEHVDGIWGCEFIENPIFSGLAKAMMPEEADPVIRQTGYLIDNTSKTRAVFEINKGANKHDAIDVNSTINKEDRRVPFEHMIYIADGPSDVPVFSIMKQYGGKRFAIFPKCDTKAFKQVDMLMSDGRIDMYAEADYSKDTMAYLWLMEHTKGIAESIYKKNYDKIIASAGTAPIHIPS